VELRALVQEVAAQLPAGAVSATDHSVAAGRDVKITASGGGIAAGVIHGNVALPDPPSRVLFFAGSRRVVMQAVPPVWAGLRWFALPVGIRRDP
jgi:hypothetical protein